MLLVISDIYYMVIELPGTAWQTVKNFSGNSLRSWWHARY
jgi:hypothetical protein